MVTVLLLIVLNAVCVGGVVNIEAAGVVDGAAGVLNNIQHTAMSLSDTGHTGTGQLQKPRSVQEFPLPAPHLTPQGEVD